MIEARRNSDAVVLSSPTEKPNACGFLWNESMMISMNCQGYANAQFMQPEPSKYAFSPSLEAKTFMQPEHPYFAHHPGRFFYLKNEQTGEVFSIPFAPCKKPLDSYQFVVYPDSLSWIVEHAGLNIELSLSLADKTALEKWSIGIERTNGSQDDTVNNTWSVYAYFPLGYMSWMNQSAEYDFTHDAIVATYVTPYQKLEDYPALKNTAQKTCLVPSEQPDAWCANQYAFEGLGGLNAPSALEHERLLGENSIYEYPCAALQHRVDLSKSDKKTFSFLFGPIHKNSDINTLKSEHFDTQTSQNNASAKTDKKAQGCLSVDSPDDLFNQIINTWLPRQVTYHCEVNRLTTDPQTRNYIQDNIGSCFLKPELARKCIITSLSQQHDNGEMPDGILLHPDAELKYINQIPHSDHCVWLPILIEIYLNQTNDYELLYELVAYQDNEEKETVLTHMDKAFDYLLSRRDYRGLSFIDQGDWCDPMNMVGAKGRGVSAWLTMASSYALKVWIRIVENYVLKPNKQVKGQLAFNQTNKPLTYWQSSIDELNSSINEHCWDKDWYARGITDDNELFGVASDLEGRIFLNPQSWALLSDAASLEQSKSLLASVTEHLQTPFGNVMLAPSFTKMDERIGRVTQKHIGSAENGSVYNHAFVFWIYALFDKGYNKQALACVQEMLSASCSKESGQLPVYIPNYFRGAYFQAPEAAGKSSHLFNTGTAAWLYRIVIEKVFGLQGAGDTLIINPSLPDDWDECAIEYRFAGASFNIRYKQVFEDPAMDEQAGASLVEGDEQVIRVDLYHNEQKLVKNTLDNIEAGKQYNLLVKIIKPSPTNELSVTIVAGVSGSGKSTVAAKLASMNKAIFVEGDNLHSSSSRSKMSRGIALDDADRKDWLDRLSQAANQKLKHGFSVVISFSGLKQVYREKVISGIVGDDGLNLTNKVNIIFLNPDKQLVKDRLNSREDHFFDNSLLDSQYAILELPKQDEALVLSDDLSVDESIERISDYSAK